MNHLLPWARAILKAQSCKKSGQRSKFPATTAAHPTENFWAKTFLITPPQQLQYDDEARVVRRI
jgi:hypothetical protein